MIENQSMYKKIETLILIPFVVIMGFGYIGVGIGAPLLNLMTIGEMFGFGYGIYLMGAYPIKIIVFTVNGIKNDSWNWPTGFKYFVFPMIIFLVSQFSKIISFFAPSYAP